MIARDLSSLWEEDAEIRKYLTIVAVAGVVLACVSGAQAAYTGGWYYTDFEDGGDPLTEWSDNRTETTPGTVQHSADRFLGRFCDQHATTLTLYNLPPHTEVTLSLDLFVIRSWDGNWNPDIWGCRVVGGDTIIHTTFANVPDWYDNYGIGQAYPQSYPPDGVDPPQNPPLSGADEIETLGYAGNKGDSVYYLGQGDPDDGVWTFPHSGSDLQIEFYGDLDSTCDDESWGIGWIEVVIPEPAALSLLALGGLALRRRRRR